MGRIFFVVEGIAVDYASSSATQLAFMDVLALFYHLKKP